MKALLIGCGGIGALYDFNTDQILTHAKALSTSGIEFDLFDTNIELAEKIGQRYNAKILKEISQSTFQNYTLVSICTPTEFHFHYLKLALKSGIPTIICEKPISLNLEELDQIEKDYNNSSSIVSVNYIRRFTPTFKRLKSTIENEVIGKPKSILVNYNRGFMNYGSHAWDTIVFLTNIEIATENYNVISTQEFKKDDPLLDVEIYSNETKIHFQSVISKKPVFDIELIYSNAEIYMTYYGNTIKFIKRIPASTGDEQFKEKILYIEEDALKDYLKYSLAYQLNIKNRADSNFMESIRLNRSMLKIINKQ